MGDLTTGYLLGQIAESYFKGLEETAVTVMTRANESQSRIDVQALFAEVQTLRNDNAYLRDDNARLQRYADQLRIWGRGLYDELDKIKGS